MYKLNNWYFVDYGHGEVVAQGVVEGHKRLEDGTTIHTSLVEMVLVKEDRLLMETYSGSHYELLFEAINPNCIEQTKQALALVKSPDKAKISDALFEQCLKCWEIKEQQRKEIMEKELKPGELYVFTSGVHIQNAYFKKQNGGVASVEVSEHIGMFQDSVLLIVPGEVDFRFFPKGWNTVMEPYHWSDGLETVIIENIGKNIEFKGTKHCISCEKGTIVRIDKSEYQGEGLMSPDFVNGKSMMMDMREGLDSEEPEE